MEIVKAVMSDSGRYECHLSNEMGSTTGICNVEVHKIFKPPFFSRQMNNVKQLINCDARYKNESSTFYHNLSAYSLILNLQINNAP